MIMICGKASADQGANADQGEPKETAVEGATCGKVFFSGHFFGFT